MQLAVVGNTVSQQGPEYEQWIKFGASDGGGPQEGTWTLDSDLPFGTGAANGAWDGSVAYPMGEAVDLSDVAALGAFAT